MKAVIEITEQEAKEILSAHYREKGYKFDEIKIKYSPPMITYVQPHVNPNTITGWR